jgi:hypothetical protein
MIIYGESLPQGSEIPATEDGLQLDALPPRPRRKFLVTREKD